VAGVMMSYPDKFNYGVIKDDAAGKQLWATKLSPSSATPTTPYDSRAFAIAVNGQGEIFVTGGLDIVGNDYMAAPLDIYTFKLNANGTVLWKSKTQGATDDIAIGYQLSLDSFGNVYVLGSNTNEVWVPDRWKMILLKYNTAGNLIWERRFSDYIDYSGYNGTGTDNFMPKLKILNDEIYVLNVGPYGLSPTYYAKMEMRKFDLDGNQTFYYKDTAPSYETYMIAHDFCVDGNGNIYIMYRYFPAAPEGKRKIVALSPQATVLWENTRSITDYTQIPRDGAISLGKNNELYIMAAYLSKFEYERISSSGETVWTKEEPLNDYIENRGNPCFSFIKEDGNPVFISTNANETDGHYYFIAERNQADGNEVTREIYAGGYDYYGDADGFYVFNELLMGVYKDPASDVFVLTGGIHDQGADAETIV